MYEAVSYAEPLDNGLALGFLERYISGNIVPEVGGSVDIAGSPGYFESRENIQDMIDTRMDQVNPLPKPAGYDAVMGGVRQRARQSPFYGRLGGV